MLLLFNLNDPTHRFVVLESTNNRLFDVFCGGGGDLRLDPSVRLSSCISVSCLGIAFM
jgi:hypothetical protein